MTMKPLQLTLAISALMLVSACANERVEPQRSPCVGLENSPCGPKRPVNGKLNEMVGNTAVAVTQAHA